MNGTSQFSQASDESEGLDLGVAWRVGIEGMIPLWTFGKITNTWDAAEAGAKAAEHGVDKERNELRLAVRRTYYGAKAARETLLIVRDEVASIDRYIPALERKVATGDADEIDLLKLRMERAELEAREAEARMQEAKALAGLAISHGARWEGRGLDGAARAGQARARTADALPHRGAAAPSRGQHGARRHSRS